MKVRCTAVRWWCLFSSSPEGNSALLFWNEEWGNIPADNFSISILVEESGFYMVGNRTTGASSSVDR